MNYANPTPIKIGMEASFVGKQYRVVGRAVLGVVEDGKVYYWNEYYLETDGGEVATVVFEVGEDGPEWRMFTMFEPQFMISAEDAASKRTGDIINLEGSNCRVTRVDHSRIYYVEGKAPEGEVVNARADYFNAVEHGRMIVVSWTGEEVECYRGMNITSGMVASAFNLRKGALLSFHLTTATSHVSGAAALVKAMTLTTIALFLFAIIADSRPVRRPPALTKFGVPPSPLGVGDTGTLNKTKYRIGSHALVEVGEVGVQSDWQEYGLTDDGGNKVLLIRGIQPGANDWVLFTPLTPIEPLTPQRAAKVMGGQMVNVDGVIAVVTRLFRTKVLQDEWDDVSGQAASQIGEIRYGFIGRRNSTLLLARWNANEITFYEGTAMKDAEVKAGFGGNGK